ncbi:MAG: hypothetical protein M1376_00745 [Planctomycetes bacterium]|nr:hypothetical protein [Planctomycetota bacterium]
MYVPHDVSNLVEEYRSLFDEVGDDTLDSLKETLMHEAEWTAGAAEHLLQLATEYGSFMLRNALAIALALDIEDGELGF